MSTLEEIRVKRIAYQKLLESEGWAEYAADLQSLQAQMLQALLEPLETSDLAYAQEYLKGELKSISRLLNYPKAKLEELVGEEQRLLNPEDTIDE